GPPAGAALGHATANAATARRSAAILLSSTSTKAARRDIRQSYLTHLQARAIDRAADTKCRPDAVDQHAESCNDSRPSRCARTRSILSSPNISAIIVLLRQQPTPSPER